MRASRLVPWSLAAAVLAVAMPLAAQGAPPAGTTGVCKDGSYTSAASKTGACSSHGGVKTWTGKAAPAPAPKPSAPPPAPTGTAAKPANATGTCGDGTFTTAKSKTGACSSHGGVKDWYAGATTTAPPPAPKPAAAPPPPPSPKGAATTAPKVAPIPGAPAAATALCNDGTYSESKHRSGTCSNHKGVKQWLKEIPAL